MFTDEERALVLRKIVDVSDGRLKIIAHVGAMPTSRAIELAKKAIATGVDAISSVPPVYYQPSERAVDVYYHALKDVAGDTPLLAYNNAAATGYELRPSQALRLYGAGTIAGVKQASTNIADLHALLYGGIPVWMANAGCAVAALAMGAQGIISTVTNVAPEKFIALFEAIEARDILRARKLQHDIDYIANRLRQPIIGALHAGSTARGLNAGSPRLPLQSPTEAELVHVREAVEAALR